MLFKFSFPVVCQEKIRPYDLFVRADDCPSKEELIDLLLVKRKNATRENDGYKVKDYDSCLFTLSNLKEIPNILNLKVPSFPVYCKTVIGTGILKISQIEESEIEKED